MARKCPNCLVVIPATTVLIYSSNIVCEPCNSPLEVSKFSRNVSAFLALIVAAVVFRISSSYYSHLPSALGWLFPVLFAYLAYSVTALVVLAFIADLQLLPSEPDRPGHEPTPSEHSSH
jgi:hypothetical protein